MSQKKSPVAAYAATSLSKLKTSSTISTSVVAHSAVKSQALPSLQTFLLKLTASSGPRAKNWLNALSCQTETSLRPFVQIADLACQK